MAAPINKVNTTRPTRTRSARSTASNQRYVAIPVAADMDGPVAVVRGLDIKVIRAAAGEIILDDRIEYHHIIIIG